MNANAWYGWRPELPDKRDYQLNAERLTELGAPETLPESIDLRSGFPAPYDQEALGSCTANAIAAILHFNEIKYGHTKHAKDIPSRLFIYYNERVMEGSVNEDAGAYIRDGIKSVVKQGAPKEPLWPYRIERFKRKPTKDAYYHAMARQALVYERLDNERLDDLKRCLVAGFPFVFGFTVYSSFESIRSDGIMPYPDFHRESILGGHAVVACGYKPEFVLVRNSWGTNWGMDGYFWMPTMYIKDRDLCDDFWAITKTE